MAKFNRKICEKCRCIFIAEKHDQKFCSELCNFKSQKLSAGYKTFKDQKCQYCGRIFNLEYERKYCGDICKETAKHTKTHKTIEEKNKNVNDQWLNNKGLFARNGRKLPFEVLEKIAEKNGFDDEGWDHYLRGRKWDRI